METLTANLAGPLREERYLGKLYLVAPVTLIVEGVLNGSLGPLFYPRDELERSAGAWNDIPLVLRHPPAGLSARSIQTLSSQALGYVRNAQFKQDRLVAEAWFERDALDRLAPDLLGRLQRAEPVEISTGLGTRNTGVTGKFNGKDYTHVARDYQPDHLAVLLDQKGACSVADGCGLLMNHLSSFEVGDRFECVLNTDGEKIIQHVKGESLMKPEEKKSIIDELIANCDCWDEGDRETLNEFKDERLTKWKERHDKEKQREAVANAAKAGATGEKPKEDQKLSLNDIPTEELEAEVANRQKAATAKKADEEKPKTDEEWLKAAPAEIQNTIQYARGVEAREREKLVAEIVENVEEEKQEALRKVLNQKSIEELETLRAIAPKKEAPADTANYAGLSDGQRTTKPKLTRMGLPGEY